MTGWKGCWSRQVLSSQMLQDEAMLTAAVENFRTPAAGKRKPRNAFEHDKEAEVLNLLSDPKLLESRQNEETDISDSSDADDTEKPRSSSLVEEMDPLLQMILQGAAGDGHSCLQQLPSDHTMLEVV
ncbi:uncharacterized protein AKAME5_002282500 [Lates japonicus]|uniref:Uncharacterized protein n=1 Tax=Lates japonicus TaxID=270547 RepID=A0AAD3NED9_LATJO|nr:uncharacterized protein AKAME5_002282500 [Lates japonicus]